MPTDPDPITLFQVVQRAVDIVDPTDTDPEMGELLRRYEDADEPVTAVIDLPGRIAGVLSDMDPEIENPGLAVAGAMILYLAHRRDTIGAEPADLLRLSARAEWKGDPPAPVRAWLEDRGVTV